MEWWTYGLSDFLMFSPQVYWRLVARYQQALWPAQLLALALGTALLVLAARRGPARPLLPCLVLAAAWAMVGWGFYWQRYAEIFLAAPTVALVAWLQALLLAGCAWLPARPDAEPSRGRWPGLALLAAGVWLVPSWPVVTGHGWLRAEVFALMPDPTALATLGWLLASRALPAWARAALAVLPALSLLLGLATRAALAQ